MTTEPKTVRTEHPHIVMTPGTVGGRPRIDGTRISVEHIAGYVNAGVTAAEIVEDLPHLTLAAVHDAISYYFDHKEDLDRGIEENSLEKAIERGDFEQGPDGILRLKVARRD
jgi:uncharacterized protein (DUF433 family)